MKLFEEDFDPFPRLLKEKLKLKSLAPNLLEKLLITIRNFETSRIIDSVVWLKKKIKTINFRSFNLRPYLPYLVLTLPLFTLLAGSFVYAKSIQSDVVIKNSELKTSEVISISKSIDKYTPMINEANISFKARGDNGPLITPRGYISQPEAVLAGFEKESAIDLDGPKSRDQLIVKYDVKKGDSLSKISDDYDISISTIRWANGMSNSEYIKSGQKLIVPRKDGVWYTAQEEESINKLVDRFSANLESTLKFNGLDKKDRLDKGDKVLIVDGEKSVPSVASNSGGSQVASASSYGSSQPNKSKYYSGGSSYNTFPYGWCTWYVASRKNIPWIGNARDWLPNSRAMGYSTGSKPVVGSIIVLNESWWGHVAIVESVSGGSVTFSEMNGVAGWGRVNSRTVSANASTIMGYIYK